jgi:stage V sporulation protein G
MDVTNVNVKLASHSGDRLKAFATMTLDGEFVVRDLKIIEGASGLFVAMPSRKLTDHCPKCGGKNHLRAKYCNDCGNRLGEDRVSDEDAQGKLHADIAHPINSECRNRIEDAVLEAYEEERRRAGWSEGGGPEPETDEEEEAEVEPFEEEGPAEGEPLDEEGPAEVEPEPDETSFAAQPEPASAEAKSEEEPGPLETEPAAEPEESAEAKSEEEPEPAEAEPTEPAEEPERQDQPSSTFGEGIL